MRYSSIVIALLFAAITACTHEHTAEAPHEEKVAATLWTAKSELFMEHDAPAPGKKAGFLIHVTKLHDFKPVTEGTLTLTFTPQGGAPFSVTVNAPARPGIYTAEATFPRSGNYAMRIALAGAAFSDEIAGPELLVGEQAAHPADEHAHGDGGEISFLKEQQWTVDFMVEPVSRRSLVSSFTAMGEIVPVAHAESTVASPVAGVISAAKPLAYIGKRVGKGEVLALIEPPVRQEGGIGQLSAAHAEAANRAVLAQKEYERAKRLYEAKAAPKRRLEEAEIALNTAKASLGPLERAMADLKRNTSGNKVAVTAPIGGAVVEVAASNGKFIEAGQPLMRIINTSTLWLKAHIPATDIGRLTQLESATFTVPGIAEAFRTKRLVTENDLVDPKTRTVPVLFEVGNPRSLLKAGMFATVAVATGRVEDALAVPEEALFEDEGRHFVFVQREGESFERREVRTGARDKGAVQIVEGLGEGERVVTRGGYYVRLAAQSTKLPDAHGHAH